MRRTATRSFQSDSRRSLRRAEVHAERQYRVCDCLPWEPHTCGGVTPLPPAVGAALHTHRQILAASEPAAALLEAPPAAPQQPHRSRTPRRQPPAPRRPPPAPRRAPPALPLEERESVYFFTHFPPPPPPPRKSETTKHEPQETAPPATTSKARVRKPETVNETGRSSSHIPTDISEDVLEGPPGT